MRLSARRASLAVSLRLRRAFPLGLVAAATAMLPASLAVAEGPRAIVGDQALESTVDTNIAGIAEAFPFTAATSGTAGHLWLYVDTASTASQATVGVYADEGGAPTSLLTQTTIDGITGGVWNVAEAPAVDLTRGGRYWLAVLCPAGDAKLAFRDAGAAGTQAVTSADSGLTELPGQWTTGGTWSSAPVSAYAAP